MKRRYTAAVMMAGLVILLAGMTRVCYAGWRYEGSGTPSTKPLFYLLEWFIILIKAYEILIVVMIVIFIAGILLRIFGGTDGPEGAAANRMIILFLVLGFLTIGGLIGIVFYGIAFYRIALYLGRGYRKNRPAEGLLVPPDMEKYWEDSATASVGDEVSGAPEKNGEENE
ncbi:MAG: hypothetical protein J5649_11355 [Lachnospiraceae bacterium]|nr:hypothetical protein [Lachnospiraceae bacterium]